jgi:serine/threonine protein kinase
MDPHHDVDYSGQTIHHYAIIALIQAGGQGRVYRGRDQRLHRDVAVKVLRPSAAADAVSRRHLIAEARALSRLNHPHVAGIYDFVTQDERDFMVMEFVPGAVLQEILAGGPLPTAEVLRLGLQLVRGLAAAHAANVVHCDIKPANVKITSSGQLKILDFGLARLLPAGILLDATPTPSGMAIVGTVPYMAPELLRGEKADERSDLFSVGAVLYEMATGRAAFPQRSLADLVDAIQDEDPPPASAVNPLVPRALEDVIGEVMHKDPSSRPQSAQELASMLEELMPGRRMVVKRRTPLDSWRALVPTLGR